MKVVVSRVLHAGYIFEYEDKKVIFDPVLTNPFSHNCYAYPNIIFDEEKIKNLDFSAIFISHVHDDHLCLKSLNLLDRDIPIYLYAQDDKYFEFLKRLKFKNIFKLSLDHQQTISPKFKITPRLALDPDVDCLFEIEIGDFRILNVVDSWVDPTHLPQYNSHKKWDLVLWPFQTLRELQVLNPTQADRKIEIPNEWLEILKILNPRYVVPSSCQFIHEKWSWYNEALFPIKYADFKNWLNIHLPQIEYLRLDPGHSVILTSDSIVPHEKIDFIIPQTPDLVDYEYNHQHRAPSVSEVTEFFPPLNQKLINKIKIFCENEIPILLKDKLKNFDVYFISDCFWKLIVHEDRHIKHEYIFKISVDSVQLVSSNKSGPIKWKTEIAIQKLWSCLDQGETLTSAYIRINEFTTTEEKDLKDNGYHFEKVDILEDPLIRILFEGHQHKYHLQQLKDLDLF